MKKNIIALIGAVSLLTACETASQKVMSNSSSTDSKASSASSSSAGTASLFAKTKQTASDKLIAVGDRVLFDYDSASLDSSAKRSCSRLTGGIQNGPTAAGVKSITVTPKRANFSLFSACT